MSDDGVVEDPHFQIDVNNIRAYGVHAPTDDELSAHAEFLACLERLVWDQ